MPAWSREKSIEVMWSKVDKSAPGGCWVWTGSTNSGGYGACSISGKRMIPVHRFVYELVNGPIPAGLWCLHRCDVKRCCNPAHLWLGTDADNTADKVRKRRHLYGENAWSAKITEEQAKEIIQSYKQWARNRSNAPELARKYGLSANYVTQIAKGRAWEHLHRPLDSRGQS